MLKRYIPGVLVLYFTAILLPPLIRSDTWTSNLLSEVFVVAVPFFLFRLIRGAVQASSPTPALAPGAPKFPVAFAAKSLALMLGIAGVLWFITRATVGVPELLVFRGRVI
jgi:hypothetical protein